MHMFKNINIEDAKKTLVDNLNKHYPKIIISCIVVSLIVFFTKMLKKISTNNLTKQEASIQELNDICDKLQCTTEDLFKIYKSDLEILSKSFSKHCCFSLESYCEKGLQGNFFFYGRRGHEAFFKAVMFMESSANVEHPLHGKDFDDIVYLDKSSNILKNINPDEYSFFKMKDESILISKENFHKFIKDKSESLYGEDAGIAILNRDELTKFIKDIDDAKEKFIQEYKDLNSEAKTDELDLDCYNIIDKVENRIYVSYNIETLQKLKINFL